MSQEKKLQQLCSKGAIQQGEKLQIVCSEIFAHVIVKAEKKSLQSLQNFKKYINCKLQNFEDTLIKQFDIYKQQNGEIQEDQKSVQDVQKSLFNHQNYFDFQKYEENIQQCLHNLHQQIQNEFKNFYTTKSGVKLPTKDSIQDNQSNLNKSLEIIKNKISNNSQLNNSCRNFNDISQKDSYFIDENSYNKAQIIENQLQKINRDTIDIIKQHASKCENRSSATERNLQPKHLQNVSKCESKERSSSIERNLQLKFSSLLKHQYIDISENGTICSSNPSCNLTRLILLQPSIESPPIKERSWIFKILKCKNNIYSSPLAIGLCNKNFVQENEFEQRHQDVNRSHCLSFDRSVSNLQYNEFKQNGCYLLTSDGIVRNHQDIKQDMRKINLRFSAGDSIKCTYNPFKKYLKFEKQSSKEVFYLNVKQERDKLYACVRISQSGDQVQVINI